MTQARPCYARGRPVPEQEPPPETRGQAGEVGPRTDEGQ